MNVVITCLLTAEPDPQRFTHLPSNSSVIEALRASVRRLGHWLVVLHDGCLRDRDDDFTSFVAVPPGGNPYFSRWRHIAAWLTDNPVNVAWCVDGTDVVMLHDPFPQMRPGQVYSGSEPYTLAGDTDYHRWLRRECPSHRAFYRKHPYRPFLNPGILGGHPTDLIAAAEQLGVDNGDLCDMGIWQRAALELFGDRLVTGHPVHTEYKAYQLDDPEAWWAHK